MQIEGVMFQTSILVAVIAEKWQQKKITEDYNTDRQITIDAASCGALFSV